MKVPFTVSGVPHATVQHVQYDWKDNFEFDDELEFTDFYRGRSAAGFEVISRLSGLKYPVFLVDLLTILQTMSISDGCVVGRWTFAKRGIAYGIKPVLTS